MAPKDEDTPELAAGLRAADPEAMERFFAGYAPAIERLAARRLAPGLRRRIGPESIALSVCRTFLRRAEAGALEVPDGEQLWSLLCAITLNKVREKVRFHRRQRRAVDREMPGLQEDMPLADARPGPDEQVAFAEAFDGFLAGLGDEERTVVELRLQERTNGEIAAELGCSERTVRRLLAGLRERLETRLAGR